MLELKSFAVTTVLAFSLAIPATAAAQGQDLRNPDRQFPAAPASTQDLRNPDRRAPKLPEPPEQAQDLRNPDRRAPGAGQTEAAPVTVPATTTIELTGDGFDWGDAGVGAAGGTAVLAMLVGLGIAATRSRRGTRTTA